MSAIRLARGFTGRDVIVKFAGCYHGHVDSLLVSAGSSALTLGVPNSPGVPKGCTADTLVLRYNDVAGLRRGVRGARRPDRRRDPRAGRRQHGAGRRRRRSSCAELRRLTQQHGALLIYDEVMTGFRLALRRGAGAARQTARPDGARQDRRRRLPGRGVRRPGATSCRRSCRPARCSRPARSPATRWRWPPASPRSQELQATPAVRPARTARPDARATGCAQAARDAGVPHQFNRVGSMWTLFFTADAGDRLRHAPRRATRTASPGSSGR